MTTQLLAWPAWNPDGTDDMPDHEFYIFFTPERFALGLGLDSDGQERALTVFLGPFTLTARWTL